MAKIQIKNSFITSSADITISSSMVKFSSGISAKNITGSFSGSIPALTSYYKQGGNSFGTTAILGTNDNQALTFETNNSEKVRIATDGNVGISTTSPAGKLHVVGGGGSGTLVIQGSGITSHFHYGTNEDTYIRPGKTAGQVFIADVGGNVGIGTTNVSAKLHVTGSSSIPAAVFIGNVGIGTTSPSNKLTVVTSTQYDGYYLRNSNGVVATMLGVGATNDDGTIGLYSSVVLKTSITANGVSYFNGGSVGIGTSSPATTLNISGSTRISAGELQIEGNNAALRLYRTSGINYFDWASGQNLYLGTVTSVGGAGRTNKMVILNDGNVGIGTNAPTQRLDLSGSLRIRSSGTYSDPTDNAGFINYDSSGGIFTISARSNGGSTYMAFRTSNSGTGGERMRIINDGNIGIGTSSPSEILDVYRANTGGWNPRIVARDGTNAAFIGSYSGKPGVFAHNNALSAWADLYLNTVDATTLNSGKVFIGGNVGIGTTSPLARLHVSGSSTSLSAIFNGCVGIGTTSPVAKLSVYTTSPHGSPTGISVAAGTGGANLLARDSGNYHNWFPYTDGFNYYSADSHVFRSSNHLTNYVYINSNGNLGIGTTSPAGPLDVVGSSITAILRNTSATNYAGLRIYNDQNSGLRALEIDYAGSSYSGALITSGPTGESAAITTTGAYPLVFGTNNSARMTILSGGNVGIGTNSPSARFHVSGSSYFQGYTRVFVTQNNTIGTSGDAGNLQVNSINVHPNSTTETMYVRRFNSGIFQIQTVLASANAGELHLEPYGGNVGIGTTTVDAKLRVLGNVRATSFTGSFSGSVVGSNMFVQGGNSFGTTAILGTSDNQALILETNNTEKLRITTVGNVGIGTSTPTAKLQIGTQTYSTAPDANYFVVGNDNFSGTGPVGAISGYPATANRNQVTASLFDVVGGWEAGNGIHALLRASAYDKITTTPAFVVLNNGNVGIGTNTPNALGGLHVYKANSGGLGGYVILDNNGLAVANETALMFGDGGTSYIRAAISSTTEDSPYYGDIKFKTGNSVYSSLNTRMIIKGNGNVGIGTTSPASLLQLGYQYTTAETLRLGISYSVLNTARGAITWHDSGNITGQIDTRYDGTRTNMYFGSLYNSGYTSNVSMTILGSGNVGIGTTSPICKLNVTSSASTLAASFQGNVGVGNTAGYYYGLCSLVKPTSGLNLNIMYASLSSGYGEILMSNYNDNTGASGWASYIRSYSNPGSDYSSILTFGTSPASLGGPSERMRITAAGYVGIGTSNTTPYSSLFPGQLVIDSGTSNVDGIFVSTNNSNAAELVLTKKNTTNSFGSLLIQHAGTSGDAIVVNYSVNTTTGVSGTNSFKVTTGGDGYFKGNVGIGTTSFVYAAANRGLLEIYGSTDSLISLRNSNNPFYIQKYSTDVYINNTDNGALILNTNNTERARITSVGNVGIGTNNPGYKLDVSGSVFISGVGSKFSGPGSEAGYRLKFYDNGGINNDPGIGLDGAGGGSESMWFNTLNGFYWNMGTNGVKMLLNSSGNLGIGTSTPTSKLHVIETTATGSRIQLGTSSANSLMSSTGVNDFIILTAPFGPTPASTNNNGAKWGIKLNGSIDSPNTKGKAACIYAVSEEPGAGYNRRVGLALHTSPFDLDSVERLRISNDGNVGIGTTSPADKLDINGNLYFSKASDPRIYAGTGIGLNIDGQALWLNRNTNASIIMVTGGGNVGIGTTGPSSKLHIYDSTYSFTRCTNTTNAGHYVDIGANSGGQSFLFSYGAYPVLIGTNGSERIRVDSGGNVGIGTSSPSTYTTQLAIETTQTRAIMAFNTALADTGTLFGLGFGYAMSTYNSAYLGFYKASSGSSSNRLFFSLWNQDNILNILGSGNVGVGTTAPISKLNTYASGSNLSVFRVDGGNGTLFEVTDQLSGSLFSVNDVSGLPLLEVFSNNRIVAGKYGSNALVISGSSVGIGTTTPAYKLQVNGSFGATTKSFVIDHPTKEGKKLVYGSLESPYHGIRLTGRNVLIDGECKVQLPDYIYKLARPESVNIQITPIKCGKVIYVDEISVENNYFVVKYDKSLLESYKNYEFFWDFTATRSDVDELTVEQ